MKKENGIDDGTLSAKEHVAIWGITFASCAVHLGAGYAITKYTDAGMWSAIGFTACTSIIAGLLAGRYIRGATSDISDDNSLQ